MRPVGDLDYGDNVSSSYGRRSPYTNNSSGSSSAYYADPDGDVYSDYYGNVDNHPYGRTQSPVTSNSGDAWLINLSGDVVNSNDYHSYGYNTRVYFLDN